jgi:hypothetical protein
MIGMGAKFEGDGGGTVNSTAHGVLNTCRATLDWRVLRGEQLRRIETPPHFGQ